MDVDASPKFHEYAFPFTDVLLNAALKPHVSRTCENDAEGSGSMVIFCETVSEQFAIPGMISVIV